MDPEQNGPSQSELVTQVAAERQRVGRDIAALRRRLSRPSLEHEAKHVLLRAAVRQALRLGHASRRLASAAARLALDHPVGFALAIGAASLLLHERRRRAGPAYLILRE